MAQLSKDNPGAEGVVTDRIPRGTLSATRYAGGSLQNASQLAKEGVGVRHIPMLGNFTLLKAEHVYDIKVQAFAA
jgi:hypothetical protein